MADKYNVSVDELKLSYPPDTPMIKEFVSDNLITVNGNEIDVTDSGSLFIRNIAAAFDSEYIRKVQTYSKTV
jgi:oxygen-independent coproporphyrinogen-3 oxidase